MEGVVQRNRTQPVLRKDNFLPSQQIEGFDVRGRAVQDDPPTVGGGALAGDGDPRRPLPQHPQIPLHERLAIEAGLLLHAVEVRDPRLVHQGIAAAFILEGAHHPFVDPPTMTVPQARPPVRRLERQLGSRLRLVGRMEDLVKQAAGPLPDGFLRQRVHPIRVLGAGGRRSRKPDRKRRAQEPGRQGEADVPTTLPRLPRAPVTRHA